jgi:hypothetical protein
MNMEDFIRTRNTGAFSEIRENIPFVFTYNPQSLSYYDKRLSDHDTCAIDCLDKIRGVHECCIINKGKNKRGWEIFQMYIEDVDISISFTPSKWEGFVQDVSKDKFVQPTEESEYKKAVLDIYVTENINHDPLDYLEEIDKTDKRPQMRDFLLSLSHVAIPLREINMEKDREMWQAYIDGQAALNADNKELYKVISVGDFKKENYNGRKQVTVTLKLQATSLVDNVLHDLKSILGTLYTDVDIEKKSEKTINVTFPNYENLSEDLITEIGEKVAERCFKFDGILTNTFSADLRLSSKDDFQEILAKIDNALTEDFGAELHRDGGVYQLDDDEEAEFINAFVEKAGYKDSVFTSTATIVEVKFEINSPSGDAESDRIERKRLMRPLVMEYIGNPKIKFNISEGTAILSPESKNEYINLYNSLSSSVSEDLAISVSDYKPLISISLKTDDVDYCKNIFGALKKALNSIRTGITFFCKDKETYRDFELSLEFSDDNQLSAFKQCLEEEVRKYNSLIDLSYGDTPNGTTSFNVTLDHAQLQRFNITMQREFKLQDVRLINGEKYNAALEDLNEKIAEKDNEWDYDLIDELKDEIKAKRKVLTEVMGRGSIRLGRCLSRTMDTVRFEVGPDFIQLIQSKEGSPKVNDFIHIGDYIQFPLSGESVELSRQQESMYRITQPNTTVKIQEFYKKVSSPANPLLSQFLFDPRYARDPMEDIQELIANIDKPGNHIESRMNENQKKAVATAVAAPDFAIIQGPPGTGKTTVIAEIIWQEIRRNPKVKILLTSQTNLAVDNALGRLKGKPGIRPARILPQSKSESERLNFDEKRYLLSQLDQWAETPNENNIDNGAKLWIDRIKENISTNEKYADALSKWKNELESADKMMRREFVTTYKENINLVAATCSICGSWQFREIYTKLFNDKEEAFDVVIMDEASKATPLEMAVPMVWGKKIIIIGDHKQLPPMMQEGNILDALKRIGRKDLADRIEQFKESQFELLYEASSKLKNSLVAHLNEQYRMHEQIMNTINHFYKDENNGQDGLICGIKQYMDSNNPDNGGSRYHGIQFEPFMNPGRHVLWVDVPDLEDKQAIGSTSRTNKAEAEAISLVIKALKKSSGFSEFMEKQKSKEDKEIGIITFYGAQAALIEEMKKTGKLDTAYNYRINVVDKFQGMERNIVIISTVRSNNDKDFGFTSDPRRINVGFSRAKCLLIIVGNRSFLSKNSDYAKAIAAIGDNRIDVKTLKHLIKNG